MNEVPWMGVGSLGARVGAEEHDLVLARCRVVAKFAASSLRSCNDGGRWAMATDNLMQMAMPPVCPRAVCPDLPWHGAGRGWWLGALRGW
jgi:hypothetical protein